MSRTVVPPESNLVYLDTTGDGTVDSFVLVDVSSVDFFDGAPAVWCVVETTASHIGLDGLPGHVRVVQRVLAERGRGHVEEVSMHEVDLDPVDPDVVAAIEETMDRASEARNRLVDDMRRPRSATRAFAVSERSSGFGGSPQTRTATAPAASAVVTKPW